MKITTTCQGRLLEVRVFHPEFMDRSASGATGVPRGTVRGLSTASRRRLLKELMRIHWADRWNKFVTLTYPAAYPSVQASKADLRAFLERMRRRWPDTGAIWRLEFQKRGAPHFHIVSPNWPYQAKDDLQSVWGEIIDWPEPFTRIDAFDEDEMVRYIAKYAAKRDLPEEEGQSVQICANNKTNEGGTAWTGRMWGVHNRSSLPYHQRVQHSHHSWELYQDLRSKSTEEWPGLADVPSTSYSLFVKDAADFAGLTS